MVVCSAYNCTGDGKALFKFPKDVALRRKWVQNVKRQNFRPTLASRLCESHFTNDCFVTNPELMKATGIYFKLALRDDAVPTIFDFSSPKKKCHQKGKHTFMMSKTLRPKLSPTKGSPVKKFKRSGGAFIKRKRNEIISNLMQQSETEHTGLEDEAGVEELFKTVGCQTQTSPCHNEKNGISVYTQTEPILCQSSFCQSEKKIYAQKCTQTSTVKPITHSKRTQMSIPTDTIGIQTQILQKNKHKAVTCQTLDEESDHEDFRSDSPEWRHDVSEEELSSDFSDSNDEGQPESHEERKFIVFESCLMQLFAVCLICLAPCYNLKKVICGTLLRVHATCINGHKRIWNSQHFLGDMPLGNFLVAASTLFSGCQPAKIYLFFHNLRIPQISERTFNRIQRYYLVPSVFEHWEKERTQLIQDNIADIKVLGGDARMDSPGFTAKYGSYSLMDLSSKKIISVQTIQSNEVGGSSKLELNGLKRAITDIEQHGINFDMLVTDRHGGVKKYMREKHSNKKHRFDAFHVAKSIGKKVEKIGKIKKTKEVLNWVQAIKNHLHWCASTSNDNEQLIKEKWLSLFNHIINVHEHEATLYKKCPHGALERDWLKKGSKGYKELKDKLTKAFLVNDIMKLSPKEQTSYLESFHNIVLYFAPKHTHFHFLPMAARVLLAAIHFNENSDKPQLETKDGEKRWRVSYLKYKNSGVVKPIKSKSTYRYVTKLVKGAIARWHKYPSYEKAKAGLSEMEVPSPLSSAHEKEAKSDLVKKHRGRFSSDIGTPAPSEGSTMEGALQVQPEKKSRGKKRTASAMAGDNLLQKRRKIASKRTIRK